MIGDSKGRLALVLVDFAALLGGLGFLLLGYLPWPWLKTGGRPVTSTPAPSSPTR